jgi:hypothetical protein
MPAIDAGYDSAEIHVGGKIFNGLAMISIEEGQDLSKLGAEIQTFYAGTISMESRDCGITVSPQRYSGSEAVVIPISGPASHNCLITATVSPEYPHQGSQAIQVFSFRAYLAIRVLKHGESWVGLEKKVSGDFSSPVTLDVGGSGPVRAVFSGCGTSFDKSLPLSDGKLTVELNQLVKQQGHCVLEGVVISPDYQDLLVNILVSNYDPKFIPLSAPMVQIQNGDVLVTGDPSVSVIALDQKLKMNDHGKFKFDPTAHHVVRMLTVKGRSVISIWDTKEWRVLQ